MCGCGCSTSAEAASGTATVGADVVRVDDMSCSHCVATITEAIYARWPSAEVKANLAGKTVSVLGVAAGADVRSVIREAGYTPAG